MGLGQGKAEESGWQEEGVWGTGLERRHGCADWASKWSKGVVPSVPAPWISPVLLTGRG